MDKLLNLKQKAGVDSEEDPRRKIASLNRRNAGCFVQDVRSASDNITGPNHKEHKSLCWKGEARQRNHGDSASVLEGCDALQPFSSARACNRLLASQTMKNRLSLGSPAFS